MEDKEDTRKQRKGGKPTIWEDPGKMKNMLGLAIIVALSLLLLVFAFFR